MSDLMTFPNTVEEFMEQYKIIDTEQVYTNGAELVPIFRMKQWFEHLPTAEPRVVSMKLEMDKDWVKKAMEEAELTLVAEPKKGKWIYEPELYPMGGAYGHYECDQCGEWIRGSMTNYCPNCGARMENAAGVLDSSIGSC